MAKATYRLPYAWAAMSIRRTGDEIRYASQRRSPRSNAASQLQVRIGERIAPEDLTALDHFLTARWALGSTLLGRPIWAEIEHAAWPLHRAEVLELSQTLTDAAGLPEPAGAPYALWSPGVQVRIGLPRPARARAARNGSVS